MKLTWINFKLHETFAMHAIEKYVYDDVQYLPDLSLSVNLLGSILILVIGICIYLHYTKKNNNKRINIDYDIDKYHIPDFGILGSFIAVYDKNPVNNSILQDIYFFYWTRMPPYATPIVKFDFTSFFPRPTHVEYFYRPDDGMITIVWKNNYSLIAFSDSNYLGALDTGSESLWCYIPSTRRIRTGGLLGFITYYIGIPWFLPKGGGIWIQGPVSYVGMLCYKIKGYKFYSGGKPLITRINSKGKLEIFIRDSIKPL